MNQASTQGKAAQKRILLAVDDSRAAHRALQYVGMMIAGRPDFHVVLYHRLPALPPELREHGGSEFPPRETELGRELSQRIAAWVSTLEADLQPTLVELKEELVKCGVAPDAVDFCIDRDVYPGETLAFELRRMARERQCGTIAVAREHVPIVDGFGELDGFFRHHTGDELVRKGAGVAVWVVG
jgi:hypothetical protein